MNNYTIHFFLALLVVLVILVFFLRKRGWKILIAGMVLVPFCSYCVFFDYDVGLINSALIYLIGYFGSLLFLLAFLFLVSFKFDSLNSKKDSCLIRNFVAITILQLLMVELFLIFPWGVNTFPLSNADAVLYALLMPTNGADNFVWTTFVNDVVLRGFACFAGLVALELSVSWLVNYRKIGGSFAIRKVSFRLDGGLGCLCCLKQIEKIISIFLFGCVAVNSLMIPAIVFNPVMLAYIQGSTDSPFYIEQYKNPSVVSFAGEKDKNLVVIFLESMTSNFQKYTPEINSMKKKGVAFEPGSENVSGTSWTFAGILSSICGLPVNMPITDSEYHGRFPTYLPNATCLSDLLKERGYKQFAIQGSSASYTQFRELWKSHGEVIIHDNEYYKSIGKVSKDYYVFWGIEDSKMFSFAKEEISEISKGGFPFAFYISSIDTHQPEGYLDSACHYDEDSQYKNVLRCSSSMVNNFIMWMSEQSWFENTVVLVVGDHSIQRLAAKAGLPQDEKLYTLAFMLNSGVDGKSVKKKFTNLDYAPTILEAMGWNLPDHAFGLGRSLLSNEPTMLEIYGRDSLDALLRQRSIQYDEFMIGKQK